MVMAFDLRILYRPRAQVQGSRLDCQNVELLGIAASQSDLGLTIMKCKLLSPGETVGTTYPCILQFLNSCKLQVS